MKNCYKKTFLFAFFLFLQFAPFGNWGAYAQLYPVQLSPIFNSPYSIKISDYATSMDTKMRLLVNPTDFAITQRQVRLKLYIQGNGLNIQSSDYIQGQRQILINGGELQTLTNTDIATLFRLENLQGITATQYANGLPDGMYSFCFEMYDYVTNQKISQKSCTSLYLILNDPPLLNTPQKKEQIAATDFPNILFTWTPRQTNATNVSYKFEIKQLIDPTLDPQFAFQMSPILHEETLFGTALLYNLSMPILTPGMQYAWRVKAISTTGLSENAVFKNNGYSEIYSFKYSQKCNPPTFALSEIVSPSSVKISWQGLPDHTKYQIQYRKKAIVETNKKGKEKIKTFEWFSTSSKNNQALLTNLEPETSYEFKVGSTCSVEGDGIQSFNYSNTNIFTIPKKEKTIASYNCGIKPAINISNKTPLTNLIQDETFTAGDFPVTILELKGQSPYSGRGYIIVPYLAATKIAVQFSNITINTDYQLIDGVVETTYDPSGKNIVDLDEIFNDAKNSVSDLLDSLSSLIKKSEDLLVAAKNDIETQEKRDEIWLEFEKERNEKFKLLFNSSDLPQTVKDDINKVAGNTFSASTGNTAPKLTEFASKAEELKAQMELVQLMKQTEKTFEELISFLDIETVLKCKKCNEEKKEKKVQIDKIGYSSFAFSPYNKDRYVCILGALVKDEFKLQKINPKSSGTKNKTLLPSTKRAFNAGKSIFLSIVHTDAILVDCAVKYDSQEICSPTKKVDAKTEKEITEEIAACYKDNKMNFILPALANAARKNQSIEFFYNNEVYRFYNDKVEKVENALTDEQINNGDWKEGADVKIRYVISKNGVIAYKALGFRNNLPIVNKKTADLKKLAIHIKEKGNDFFNAGQADYPTKTPKQAGLKINNQDTYADGKKLEINENASFYKISYEGIGLVTSFLKTAEVEEKTYLDHPTEEAIIKVPGLVTGTLESAATVVTDITSLCSLAFDLATDENTQTEMWSGLVMLKEAIKEEPSGIIPIFAKILSGNTTDEWVAIAEKQTDQGKKGHFFSRGVVTSVKSILVGGVLITKLPTLAEDLVGKIKKVTKPNLLNSIEDVLKSLDPKTLKKLSECQGFDKVLQDMTQYWTKFKGGKFQLEYAAKLVEDGKNVRFEVNSLSTVHNRIYDIEVTFFENTIRKTKKLELKNWNNFYPASIKSQFVKDLATMKNLGDVQWVFNKTDKINDITTLKSNVMGALKNADGTAIKALDEISMDQVKKLLGENFGDIDKFNKSKRIVEALEDNSVFKIIFKIAE